MMEMFDNFLLQHLLCVKKQDYNVDFFRPESVRICYLAFLQKSYDIHNLFISLFEKRQEENSNEYQDWKGNTWDEDWSLPKRAGYIADFYELPKSKQKEFKAEVIEEFFRNDNVYKSSVYTDAHRHTLKMRDWRLKPQEVDENDDV